MNIIKPYGKIVGEVNGEEILKKIECAGRISHRSENLETETSYLRFIKAVIVDHGDWSVAEHATVSVEFMADRAFQQQITRHRLFSYTIESQRFVNYTKKLGLSFCIPAGMSSIQSAEDDSAYVRFVHSVARAEEDYNELIRLGRKPEDARSVLPMSAASKMLMTGNCRAWRHLFLMRTTKETQASTRNIIIPLLEEFKKVIPILYDDIIPNERQVVNLSKPK